MGLITNPHPLRANKQANVNAGIITATASTGSDGEFNNANIDPTALVLGDYIVFTCNFRAQDLATGIQYEVYAENNAGTKELFRTVTANTLTTFLLTEAPPARVDDVADWVDIRLFVEAISGAPRIFEIEANSILYLKAESINITNEIGKKNLTDISFYSSGVSEGINGKVSDRENLDFINVNMDNQIANKLEWSGNSGDTIYSWGGNTIGFD